MTSVPQPQLLTPGPQGPTVATAAVWLLVVVLVGCGGGRAEPPLAARLQQTLERERVAQHIPGAAAAVVADGRVVWVGVSGLADVRRRVPVHRDTRFAIASVTKPFVAGLVAQLDAGDVLGLDDPRSRWVPRLGSGSCTSGSPAGTRGAQRRHRRLPCRSLVRAVGRRDCRRAL